MNSQLGLFGDQLRDQAVQRVGEAAHAEWMKAAYQVVRGLAAAHRPFTTDAVWVVLANVDLATHEQRAMGAVITSASKDGLIRPTGRWQKSERPACHSRPVREWIGT